MVERLEGKILRDEAVQEGKRANWVMKGLASHFKEVQLTVP